MTKNMAPRFVLFLSILIGAGFLWRQAFRPPTELGTEFELNYLLEQKLGKPLTQFAEKHRLVVLKNVHDEARWDLDFRHPKGGYGSIRIRLIEEPKISIRTVWHIDEFQKKRRLIRWGEEEVYSLGEIDLHELLLSKLKSLLELEPADLEVAKDFDFPWSDFSEQEFEEMAPGKAYPFPKL